MTKINNIRFHVGLTVCSAACDFWKWYWLFRAYLSSFEEVFQLMKLNLRHVNSLSKTKRIHHHHLRLKIWVLGRGCVILCHEFRSLIGTFWHFQRKYLKVDILSRSKFFSDANGNIQISNFPTSNYRIIKH